LLLALLLRVPTSVAGGGLFGIDHELTYDNSGIWRRSNQEALEYGLIGGEVVGAIWEGGETRFGRTLWQSVDASAASGVVALAMKYAFSRVRPIDSNNDPNLWFKGHGNQSYSQRRGDRGELDRNASRARIRSRASAHLRPRAATSLRRHRALEGAGALTVGRAGRFCAWHGDRVADTPKPELAVHFAGHAARDLRGHWHPLLTLSNAAHGRLRRIDQRSSAGWREPS
jgi:hypothetical protein